MEMTKQDEHQIMLFEAYIDAIIDRKLALYRYPKSETTLQDINITFARTELIKEVFKQ